MEERTLREGGSFYADGVDQEITRADNAKGSYVRAIGWGMLALWCELRRIADALEERGADQQCRR